jgi:hypothetical protein
MPIANKFHCLGYFTLKGGHGSKHFFFYSWMELDKICRVLSQAYPDHKNIVRIWG